MAVRAAGRKNEARWSSRALEPGSLDAIRSDGREEEDRPCFTDGPSGLGLGRGRGRGPSERSVKIK